MISKCHAIPQNASISRLIRLSISIFTYNVLNRIQFRPTMVSIYHNLTTSYLPLFFSVHEMVLMYSIWTVWIVCLLIQIIYSLSVLINHHLIVVVGVLISKTGLVCRGVSGSSRFLVFGRNVRTWTGNLVALNVLLLLLVTLLLVLAVTLTRVFGWTSLLSFIIFTLLVLGCVLLVLLLKCYAVIVQNYLFVRTASRVVVYSTFGLLVLRT